MTNQDHPAPIQVREEIPPHPGLPSPDELVRDVAGLVSPPGLHLRLLEVINEPTANDAKLGDLLVQDPSLTARLLRIVNSAYYSLTVKVETVEHAVNLLGLGELRQLVTAASVVSSFSRIPMRLVNMDTFWRHSLYTALIAKALAVQLKIPHTDRLFIAGLLHDIGSLVLYHQLPRLMGELLMVAAGNEHTLFLAEQEQLGYGHPQVGTLLMKLWNLPETIRGPVLWHHQPEQAGEARGDAAIVNLAETLANRSGIGGYCESPAEASALLPAVWSLTGLAPTALDEEALIGDAGLAFTHMAAALRAH